MLWLEYWSSICGIKRSPILDFIGGLGGADITIGYLEMAIERIVDASIEEPSKIVYWLGID